MAVETRFIASLRPFNFLPKTIFFQVEKRRDVDLRSDVETTIYGW